MKKELCRCADCVKLTMSPELPSLTPLPDISLEWSVDCHWLSPPINNHAILIHRAFYTDGASVPAFAWRTIGHPFEKSLLPHCLGHDALYAGELMPRKDCDEWMHESMVQASAWFPLTVPKWKIDAMYYAVRAGGWYVWNQHTPTGIAASRKKVELIDMDTWSRYRAVGCFPGLLPEPVCV